MAPRADSCGQPEHKDKTDGLVDINAPPWPCTAIITTIYKTRRRLMTDSPLIFPSIHYPPIVLKLCHGGSSLTGEGQSPLQLFWEDSRAVNRHNLRSRCRSLCSISENGGISHLNCCLRKWTRMLYVTMLILLLLCDLTCLVSSLFTVLAAFDRMLRCSILFLEWEWCDGNKVGLSIQYL